MKFRTEIEPLKGCPQIDHRSRILMIGSCFTDEIGGRLRSRMFDVTVNPFGTLFNPESMAMAIDDALDGRRFSADDLFVHEGRWRTFSRHSSFATADIQSTLNRLNDVNAAVAEHISQADTFIFTFGSAIAFRLRSNGQIVANCHKQPQQLFERVDLSIDAIVSRWQGIIARLRCLSPDCRIILTVSPVRHAGYGAVADRRSKSRLLLACEALCEANPATIYFPSYEIMVDDLRDYRFYADDMAHPSQRAVEYIYEKFAMSLMTDATRAEAESWHRLSLRASHRFETSPDGEFIATTNAIARRLAEASAADTDEMITRFNDYFNHAQSC